jgi:hypothetical protein
MARQGRGRRAGNRPDQFNATGRVRTAAGGTRNRGGAIVPQRTSVTGKFGSKYSPEAQAKRRRFRVGARVGQQIYGLRPQNRVLTTPAPANPGGNTGATKGADKASGAGSAGTKSVFRRARPGEFTQRARGANARARLRNLARTGSPATQQRARALAARVGVRV